MHQSSVLTYPNCSDRASLLLPSSVSKEMSNMSPKLVPRQCDVAPGWTYLLRAQKPQQLLCRDLTENAPTRSCAL